MTPVRAAQRSARPRASNGASARTARDVVAVAEPSVLREYALLADGLRGALIGPGGDLAWMCFPGWADAAVFAGLLGSGGVFRIVPESRFVAGGYYEDGTLVWHRRWVTEHGIFESREALVYPGDPRRAVVLRRLRAVEGRAEMRLGFAPSDDYGRHALSNWRRSTGVVRASNARVSTRLNFPGDIASRLSRGGSTLSMQFALEPGRDQDFVFELMLGDDADYPPVDADDAWRATEEAWHGAVPLGEGIVASSDVRRSVAVLRGLTDPTGASVAAVTTSLPERADSNRNYDYRFCWVRDTCYVGQAGAALPGGEVLLDDAVRWVTARLLADGVQTAPAYLADGSPIYPPRRLGLPGYPGGTDVIGNRVREQFQLDIFGDSLLLLARAAERDRLDVDGFRAADLAIDAIGQCWTEAESGIWELEPAHWTHSRLIGVAGLRAIAGAGLPARAATRALMLADHLLDEASASCLHPSGRWQRAVEDDGLDAALLLAEIRGALSPSDPRSVRTRDAIANELSEDHFLYRQKMPGHELGEDEGAFLICNFWMTLAKLGAGDELDALRWFERGRAAMSTSGLFSEEFDTEEHQLRGNLPQTFVHALFIEAAAAQGPIG